MVNPFYSERVTDLLGLYLKLGDLESRVEDVKFRIEEIKYENNKCLRLISGSIEKFSEWKRQTG